MSKYLCIDCFYIALFFVLVTASYYRKTGLTLMLVKTKEIFCIILML